eukprot:COSAG02_NODE_12926_length_1471_cov_2.026239_1_plen_71_part_10
MLQLLSGVEFGLFGFFDGSCLCFLLIMKLFLCNLQRVRNVMILRVKLHRRFVKLNCSLIVVLFEGGVGFRR